MIWKKRSPDSSKTGTGKKIPGAGLALRLTALVCIGGLNLFVTNARGSQTAHPSRP
jgi:hypothetical protein